MARISFYSKFWSARQMVKKYLQLFSTFYFLFFINSDELSSFIQNSTDVKFKFSYIFQRIWFPRLEIFPPQALRNDRKTERLDPKLRLRSKILTRLFSAENPAAVRKWFFDSRLKCSLNRKVVKYPAHHRFSAVKSCGVARPISEAQETSMTGVITALIRSIQWA